jgi:hypothetical protein
LHRSRRDNLLVSWEAEEAGVKAVVDALAMAMAAAGAEAEVDALTMAMAAAAGTVTTSASQASVAFGDDHVVGEILDANNARRARDDDAKAGVDTLAMAIAAAGAEAGVDALAMAMAAAAGTVTTSGAGGGGYGETTRRGMRTCAHNN